MEDFSVAGLSISKVVTSSFNPSSYRFTNGPIGTPSHTPQRRSIQVPRTSCHGPSPATDPIHATVAGTPSTHCTDGSSHGRKVPPVRLQPGTPVPTRKKWMFPQSQPFPCCKGFQASHIGTTICFWLGLFFFFFRGSGIVLDVLDGRKDQGASGPTVRHGATGWFTCCGAPATAW